MRSANFLAEVMRRNMTSLPRVQPRRNASNRLQDIYAASRRKHGWPRSSLKMPTAASSTLRRPRDGNAERTHARRLAGRLSLTGRHGFFSTYEAFVHIIDSMFNQHAKWLEKSKQRTGLASADFIAQSADHFRWSGDRITTASPTRIPVSSTSSATRARQSLASIYRRTRIVCLASPITACAARDYVNVIVADKQEHLRTSHGRRR